MESQKQVWYPVLFPQKGQVFELSQIKTSENTAEDLYLFNNRFIFTVNKFHKRKWSDLWFCPRMCFSSMLSEQFNITMETMTLFCFYFLSITHCRNSSLLSGSFIHSPTTNPTGPMRAPHTNVHPPVTTVPLRRRIQVFLSSLSLHQVIIHESVFRYIHLSLPSSWWISCKRKNMITDHREVPMN